MTTGIATPADAYAAFLAAWPKIVEECCAVWGSELHYQAMIYHALRTTGAVPRCQVGMNVKIWLEGCRTPLFRKLDKKKHPEYRGGFEPIPDVVIFHGDIVCDWRRRNYEKTAEHLLLAVEVKASERDAGRLGPGEIISDIAKLDAFREELRLRGTTMVPVMVVIDTAKKPGERMTASGFEEVRDHARELEVPFFYCGPERCVMPEPGTRLGRRWTEGEFMARLEHQASPDVVPIAKALLGWAKESTDTVRWGRGNVWGSFTPVLVVDGYNYNSISVWTNGLVDVQLEYLQYQPPFDAPDTRRELARRLNQIPGIDIPGDAPGGCASIRLDLLLADGVLARFLDVIDWVITEMRENAND